MTEHSPTPWRLERPEHELIRCSGEPFVVRCKGTGYGNMVEKCQDIQIWTDSGNGFYHGIAVLPMAEGDPVDEANAALIVRAVNSHDALEAALANLIDAIGATMAGAPDGPDLVVAINSAAEALRVARSGTP